MILYAMSAMKPCPCGYIGDPVKECSCSNSTNTRYQKRLSGPLLDRIDIHAEVPRVDYEKLSDDRLGEPTTNVQERVENARERQRLRFEGNNTVSSNADMGVVGVRMYCPLDDTGRSLIKRAMHQMGLSARAYHRVLKLSRTIADLAGEEHISTPHLAEALQYRPREM
jgi:magnesium chelatase family protein